MVDNTETLKPHWVLSGIFLTVCNLARQETLWAGIVNKSQLGIPPGMLDDTLETCAELSS